MKTWYLISVNCDGTISTIAKGTYNAMRKLNKESYHRVTSISNYNKALRKFGIN